MLSLILLRHAKSSWDTPGLDDFDRPLNARGAAAAPVMGAALVAFELHPQLILCSPSQRTRETLALIAPVLASPNLPPPRIVFEDQLYLASSADLLARVQSIPQDPRPVGASEPQAVMIIGHNPGLHDLALLLTGTGDARSLIRLQDKFPTAALVELVFEAKSWRDVQPAAGLLAHYTTPKERA